MMLRKAIYQTGHFIVTDLWSGLNLGKAWDMVVSNLKPHIAFLLKLTT